jgi:hypothetical protein
MAQPVASSKGLPAVHSATAAAPAPITDPLTVVNQKVKALYMRMLSKGPALGLPEYRDLFIEYGKAFVASKEANKSALAKGFETCVVLIEKQQKRPELTSISEVAYKTMKQISRVVVGGLSEMQNHLLFLGGLQKKLSDLVAAKEILVLSHRLGNLGLKEQTWVEARQKLSSVARPHNKKLGEGIFDLKESGILKAMESPEAFALFCRFFIGRGKKGIAALRNDFLSPKMLQELTRCTNSPNPHACTMANIILTWSMTQAVISENAGIRAVWESFSVQSQILAQVPTNMLQELVPELVVLRAEVLKYLAKMSAEKEANPDDDDMDPACLRAYAEPYTGFNAVSDQRHFTYQLMREIWEAQGGMQLTDGRLLRYSHCFKEMLLPTPEAFAALTSDNVVIDRKVSKAREAAIEITDHKLFMQEHKNALAAKKYQKPNQSKTALTATAAAPLVASTATAAAPAAPVVASTATAAAPAAMAVAAPTFAQIVAQRAFSIDYLTYADRVNIWFTDPDTALAQKPYADQPALHAEFVLRHTLPVLLDDLIGTSYCLADEWENKAGERSDLYCFVGEIEGADGSISRGVLTTAVDAGGVCWHRCWSKKTNKELLEQKVSEMIFDADFPPLEAASKQNTKKKNKQGTGKSAASPVTIGAFGIMEIKLGAGRILRLFPCASNPD